LFLQFYRVFYLAELKNSAFILFFFPCLLFAQINTDSLWRATKTGNDTSRINAYIHLGSSMGKKNPDSTIALYQIALKINSEVFSNSDIATKKRLKLLEGLSYNNIGSMLEHKGKLVEAIESYKTSYSTLNTISDYEKMSYSLLNIGFVYKLMGNTDMALQYFSQSLELRKMAGNKKLIANSYSHIAGIYSQTNNIPKAIENENMALKIAREENDMKLEGVVLNDLALLYSRNGETDQALKYYDEAFSVRLRAGDKEGQAQTLLNMGSAYVRVKKLDKGLILFRKALASLQSINQYRGIAAAYSNICYVMKMKGQIDSSIYYAKQSLAIYEKAGDINGKCSVLNNLANISLDNSQPKIALKYAEESYKIAKSSGNVYMLKSSTGNLVEIYNSLNNPKKALEMYKLHIQMRDSLNNEDNQKAVAKQQAKYEYEKQKALDDAEHEKQLAIEQEAKEKQKIITYSTAGGLALVALFLVFVFNRLQVTKRQKIVIQEAHYELEEKNNEILDSIAYAKRIQNAILPPSKLVKEYLKESFILYKPKDIVAGDFYWMEHKDGKVLFAAADCTGHGVPGAMVSVICNNGLNRSVREYNLTEPGKILDKTREIVIQEFEKSEDEVKDGMDIALCSLAVSSSSGAYRELQYAGANNPLWIIRKGAKEIEEIKATKQPIGKYANPELYITHTIELQKGDSIYIFSDGYADQFGGEKGKKFKGANFKKLLLSIQNESMEKQKELINEAFENWRGELEQIDDVCVIGVKV